MNRNLTIRKTEEKCSCNSCSSKNYNSEFGKKVETIYELEIGSIVARLCPDCLSSLSSLISPFLKEEERKEREEEKRMEEEFEEMFSRKRTSIKENVEERKEKEDRREAIRVAIRESEEKRNRKAAETRYKEAIKTSYNSNPALREAVDRQIGERAEETKMILEAGENMRKEKENG